MRALLSLPLVLVGCLGAFDGGPEPVPEWAIGDSWSYIAGSTEVTWTVAGVEDRNGTAAYRVELTSAFWNETRWYAVEHLAYAGRHAFGAETAWDCKDGPFPLLDKRFLCGVRAGGAPNSDPHRIEVKQEILLDVPAGSWRVVPYTDIFDGGQRVFGRYWYAPALGVWAAFEEGDVRYELVRAP